MSKGIIETITEVFRPQAPLWACELTSRHVIIAGVNKRRNQVEGKLVADLPSGSVTGSLSSPNIRNLDAARSSLSDVFNHVGFRGSEIAVVVPDDTARIAFVTVENPSKDRQEQQAFIRWKLKKSLPFDVDSAQVAFRVVGPHLGNAAPAAKAAAAVDVLVALCPRSIVEEYESLFASMNLHPGVVLPSTFAALNLLKSPAGDTLFLKIAPDSITTTIFQHGRIQFYRRVADVSLYDAVYPTVMYYQDKLGGKTFEQLTFCGYDSDIRSSVAELQEKLGMHAGRLEPKSIDDIYKPVLGATHLLASEGML